MNYVPFERKDTGAKRPADPVSMDQKPEPTREHGTPSTVTHADGRTEIVLSDHDEEVNERVQAGRDLRQEELDEAARTGRPVAP
jgi:hypothetical protein